MIKSVVTGGMGFIGSHLVDRLLAEGHDVTVIDNQSTGRIQNLKHCISNSNLHTIEMDISVGGEALVEATRSADYIFHLAALADIVPSIENPKEYFQANVTGTLAIAEAARKNPKLKKLVYAASSSCYGIPDVFPTPESAPMRPQYPYALTKMMGEQLLFHWGKLYRIPVVSTRFFNVYGPRSRTSGTYGAVFGVFLAQKLAKQPFTVVGDGKQTRDFTYVTDVADALFTAAQSSISGEIFNVGSGATVSVNRLVELLGGDTVHIPKRPGEPDCTFADTTKIQKMLHWKPKVTFEQGVNEVLKNIDYWREAPVWTVKTISKATEAWFNSLQN